MSIYIDTRHGTGSFRLSLSTGSLDHYRLLWRGIWSGFLVICKFFGNMELIDFIQVETVRTPQTTCDKMYQCFFQLFVKSIDIIYKLITSWLYMPSIAYVERNPVKNSQLSWNKCSTPQTRNRVTGWVTVFPRSPGHNKWPVSMPGRYSSLLETELRWLPVRLPLSWLRRMCRSGRYWTRLRASMQNNLAYRQLERLLQRLHKIHSSQKKNLSNSTVHMGCCTET